MVTALGKKVEAIFAVLSALGLLASCSSMRTFETEGSSVSPTAIPNATTSSDHKTLAKYHDDKAKDLWVKAKIQKQLLEHYEGRSYLYGKRAQDLQAHTWALIRNYEVAATASVKEAAVHRKIASELEEDSNFVSRPQKVNVIKEIPKSGL